MLVTVFTSTYNRAHLLQRLYDSLKSQTYKDFEWLIVDDGSTDDTGSIVKSFINKGNINVRYFHQANGGKHRAINYGVNKAKGELFFIVDSDDFLPHNALEITIKYYHRIKDNKTIGGICGLDISPDGKIIGSGLPYNEIVCNSLDARIKYNVTGDMKEVFRTKVLREFSFPEYNDERFCPEALLWNRIAQKYDLLFFNEPIYIAEYQAGGITDNIVKARIISPIATVTTYQELNSYNIPFVHKVKAAINYWRFRTCVPKEKTVPKLPWQWFWCRPMGYLMHLKDKR